MDLSKNTFVVGLLCLFFLSMNGQNRIMTYNIRFNNPNDGENWWENRKEDVVKLIDYYTPGILGIQEGLHEQVSFIDEELSEYHYIGVGRDDGKNKGEYTAIFYNTSSYELIKTETFWLSETPNKVSIGWDASMERICTYGVFKNLKDQSKLHIFNAHFDHIGPKARKMSAETIRQKIDDLDIGNEKIIVMGDFNSAHSDEPIQLFLTFLEDGLSNSKKGLYGPLGTFNSFDSTLIPKNRIDYIFTKNIKEIKNYRHINDKRNNGLCISDHLPVMIEF